MNCVVLISTPAGGKGTISDYINKKYNYEHISVGDLLRDEVENNTDLGKKVSKTLSEGKLVNDDEIFPLLEGKLSLQKNNFILDGTPRKLDQAIKFDKLMEKLNINLIKVIFIKTDKKIAIKRMEDRFVCEYCNESYSKENSNICKICGKPLTKREDDNLDVFEKRYNTFIKETIPVVDYYKEKGLLSIIDNNSTLNNLFNQVDKILGGEK